MKTLLFQNARHVFTNTYRLVWSIIVLACITPTFQQDASGQTKQYTYSEIIALAFEHQPLLKANQRNIDAASLQTSMYGKEYLPQMFFDFNISRWKYLLPNKQKLLGNSLNDIYTGLRVNQLVYDWDKNSIQQDVAERSVDIDRNFQRKLRQTISYSVAKAYLELLRATRTVQIQEEAISQLKEHLRNAQALYAIGKVSNLDVLKANVQIEVALDELAKARNQILLQKNNINVLSGNILGDSLDIVDTIDDLWKRYSNKSYNGTDLAHLLIAHHPDLDNSKIQQEIRNNEIQLFKTEYYPSLYAFGITNVEDSRLPIGNFNWNLGITVSYSLPFLRGSILQDKIEQTSIKVDALKENENAILQQLEATLKNNLLKMADIKSRLHGSEKIVHLGEESLVSANLKYNIGKGNSLEVLDAETVLITAKLNYNQIVIDLLEIIAELNYTVGIDDIPFSE